MFCCAAKREVATVDPLIPERTTAPVGLTANCDTVLPTWKLFSPATLTDMEIFGLVFRTFTMSASRPPHPVVKGWSGTLLCHWTCWFACENSAEADFPHCTGQESPAGPACPCSQAAPGCPWKRAAGPQAATGAGPKCGRLRMLGVMGSRLDWASARTVRSAAYSW